MEAKSSGKSFLGVSQQKLWSRGPRLYLQMEATPGTGAVSQWSCFSPIKAAGLKGHGEQLRAGTERGREKPLWKVQPQVQWRPQDTFPEHGATAHKSTV